MRWVCTERDHVWQEKEIQANGNSGTTLRAGEEKQEIWGFGACFSELAHVALSYLPKDEQEKAMRALFSPDECGFRFCRLPVGANDFAVDWYTPDDTPEDWDLQHFSLQRDQQHLIPMIKQAQALCPDLELFASPWSPPAWMKQPPVYNYGRLRNDEKTLDTYARYLAEFVAAYQREGIAIQRLCPQNEMFSDQKFPSCVWTGEQMRDFIRDHLGPVFSEKAPQTELWLGTVNGPYSDYAHSGWERENFNTFVPVILKDPKARQYIRGIAVQWGGKHILQPLQAAYPDLPLFQSECECGDGGNAFDDIFYVFELMWLYFRQGVHAFTYWNIALDETASSTWGWRQNSLITVDREKGTLRFNPEYFIMRHFAHFIPKGSRYLVLSGEYAANALAFERPDGQTVFELLNPFSTEETLRLEAPQGAVTVALPPRSLSTVVI